MLGSVFRERCWFFPAMALWERGWRGALALGHCARSAFKWPHSRFCFPFSDYPVALNMLMSLASPALGLWVSSLPGNFPAGASQSSSIPVPHPPFTAASFRGKLAPHPLPFERSELGFPCWLIHQEGEGMTLQSHSPGNH